MNTQNPKSHKANIFQTLDTHFQCSSSGALAALGWLSPRLRPPIPKPFLAGIATFLEISRRSFLKFFKTDYLFCFQYPKSQPLYITHVLLSFVF